LDTDYDSDYYGNKDYFYELKGEREETDAEYGKRIQAAKKAQEAKKAQTKAKEDKERTEYERLKAKFEK